MMRQCSFYFISKCSCILDKYCNVLLIMVYKLVDIILYYYFFYKINSKIETMWPPRVVMVNQRIAGYHKLLFRHFLQRKRWKRKKRQVGEIDMRWFLFY